MDMNKLFESLDEKVFTPDLKVALEEQFNEAVELKAAEIAQTQIDEKINELNEKADEYVEYINEKADEYTELKQEEMVENLDKYLERVVEEFVNETRETLEESEKSEKADLMIDAFEAMILAGGVDVARIAEAKDETSAEAKLTEATEKHDKLVNDIIQLQEENEKLLKAGIISEKKEGLTMIQSEKFEKLANLVEFSKDETFVEKLDTIRESITGSEEKQDFADKENLQENDNSKKPVWSHLV